MENASNLSITKPLPLLKKSLKISFRDFGKALGKAGVDIAFGKWESLAGDGVDALSAIGLTANAEEIAWLLVYRSLLSAMATLINEKTGLELTNVDVKELERRIARELTDHELVINSKFFKHPEKSEVIDVAKDQFSKWLEESGLLNTEAAAIGERLPIYFAISLHEEWCNNQKTYTTLRERLDTPFTQASERAQAWAYYMTWLQKQVYEPMFMEAFSLQQVFVQLRAYYSTKLSGQNDDEQSGELSHTRKWTHTVIDLQESLGQWLSAADKDDAIRLISGGPGSGKSSFAKILASWQAKQAKIKVLFIPLHRFEPSQDLIEAVGKFVKLDGFLPHNPLDTEHREGRLLIIFDGLDELAMQGKIAEKTAQDFVREVQRKIEHLNHERIFLQVLISGRELIIQATENIFRKHEQILHLLPYFVPEEERDDYHDPQQLLAEDQRQIWWLRYGKASGQCYQCLPPELDKGNLTEITTHPLLNYLVALSLNRGQLDFSLETNLNVIYADLLKAIYERGWAGHQHNAIQGITENDFCRILEEIALASWHGDGRTTTVGEIEAHCGSSGLAKLLARFQSGIEGDPNAKVTQLLTAFYFRQSGHDHSGERTFEFTHKSFGEYLAAKRIIREVRLISKKLAERQVDPDEGYDEREALHRWATICGPSGIDAYLLSFILDEIRLLHQNDQSETAEWQRTFSHLIEFMLRHGIPMERISPRPDYIEESRHARNAEEALLIILNSCARQTRIISTIEWSSPQAPSVWFSSLCGQRTQWENLISLSCLSYLDLHECYFNGKDLWKANLEGSNLQGAFFVAADCRYANFKQADLKNAIFAFANLRGANFNMATLDGAVLSEANLCDANLKGGSIIGANFSHIEYSDNITVSRHSAKAIHLYERQTFAAGADFCEANLKDVYLQRANLERANFEGANLEGANLEGANLKGANLKGANLEGANLKGTNADSQTTDRKARQRAAKNAERTVIP